MQRVATQKGFPSPGSELLSKIPDRVPRSRRPIHSRAVELQSSDFKEGMKPIIKWAPEGNPRFGQNFKRRLETGSARRGVRGRPPSQMPYAPVVVPGAQARRDGNRATDPDNITALE